jgi:hypothetical protein
MSPPKVAHIRAVKAPGVCTEHFTLPLEHVPGVNELAATQRRTSHLVKVAQGSSVAVSSPLIRLKGSAGGRPLSTSLTQLRIKAFHDVDVVSGDPGCGCRLHAS